MSNSLSFSLVICKLCGHKVKKLDLPKILPKKIILRCSKCNSSKNIIGVWRGNKFRFTDKGVSKKVIMNIIDGQSYMDEQDELSREKYDYYDDYDDSHGIADSMSPLEWDDEEEEWTSF